jgi:hypothetical protein
VEYLHEADPDRWPEARRRRGRELLTATHRTLLTASVFSMAAVPSISRSKLLDRRSLARLGLSIVMAALAALVWCSDSSPFYLLAVALVAAAALPIHGGPSKGPVISWAILSVLTTLLTHVIFFGEDRYHVAITPMFCLLAAAAFRTGERTPAAEATSNP